MIPYKNSSEKSGIEYYEIGKDYITIKFFSKERLYRYSYQKAGKNNVDIMKKLATIGKGLNTYLNKNVRNLFD